MLILLPPSEGKHAPSRGKPLDLSTLTFPELAPARREVLDELVARCRDSPGLMLDVLGLGPRQAAEVARDARLEQSPTARADCVYTGVLYDALGLSTLDASARRRATRQVLITSALFGVLGPADRVPAYRLSAGVRLPRLGGVARHWSRHLSAPLGRATGRGLVVDLRSSAYGPFWRPDPSSADRVATVRVLHEQDGQRAVVSHLNKSTKGRLVRALLEDAGTPGTPSDLADHLTSLGWRVQRRPTRSGRPHQLDVVVTSLTS